MSKSEDYLDNLLNTVSSSGKKNGIGVSLQNAESIMDPDKAFLDEFEKQLLEDDGDDKFLQDFEMELAGDTGDSLDGGVEEDDQSFFENLDGIVNSAKKKVEEKRTDSQDGESDFVVDTLTDTLDDESKELIEATQKDSSGELDLEDSDFGDSGFDEFGLGDDESEAEGEETEDDSDLMSLLQSDEELQDIGDMLKEGEDQAMSGEQGNAAGTAKDKKKKKKSENMDDTKQGFWAKVGRILFGEDEEDEEVTEQKVTIPTEPTGFEDLSAENLDILKELEGSNSAAAPEVAEEPAKDKKEKKKKEKKPKEKKEKKPKVKKEKKPKPPKEKDNTPPLPKKPVILIFIMAISLMLLILLGSNLISYSSTMSEAKHYMDNGEYTKAYKQMSGVTIKEQDLELYEQARILASVSSQYDAYQVFLNNNDYERALDSLITTIGRYDINYEDAELYNCIVELSLIESYAEIALSEQFGIGVDRAREIYNLRSREDYSIEIYKIIQDLGLGKVTEE